MTHCRVRPRTVSEAIRDLPPRAGLQVPLGSDWRSFYAMPWHEVCPKRALTVGAKARQCVEYDRKCDRIAKARG